MTTWDLTFPQPNVPLSQNNVRHWAHTRARVKPWKDMAWAYSRNRLRQVTRGGRGFAPVPVTVQLTLSFRSHRRRDAHNFTGTVVKAVVDGLVTAGVIPDDTPEWVTVLDSQVRVIPKPDALTAIVAIRPRPTQEN